MSRRSPFIALYLTIVFLFVIVAIVSAHLQQPLTALRPRRGGHHGPHHGHHRPPQLLHNVPRNPIPTQIPNPHPIPNQIPKPNLIPSQNHIVKNNRGPRHGHHRPPQVVNNLGQAAPRIPIPNPNQKQSPNQGLNQRPLISNLNQPHNHDRNQNANLNQNLDPNPPLQVGVPPSNDVNTRNFFGWGSTNNILSESNGLMVGEFLNAHNWVRKKYNLPPYVWDEKLQSHARQYLIQRSKDCKLVHSESEYGENIFWGKKLHWTPSDAVYYWYKENDWFDFTTLKCTPPFSTDKTKTCGHFTQMVWRDSVRVGCAVQSCHQNLGMLIACEYDPPGNFDNENPLVDNTAKNGHQS